MECMVVTRRMSLFLDVKINADVNCQLRWMNGSIEYSDILSLEDVSCACYNFFCHICIFCSVRNICMNSFEIDIRNLLQILWFLIEINSENKLVK